MSRVNCSSDYSRILEEVIRLINIEMYSIQGVGSGERIVATALREGAANLYSYDGKSLVKLNREPVSGAARVPYGASRVVFTRDVARGREQHLLFTVSLDSPGEEERVEGVEPSRIMGVVYDDERIVYVSATMGEIAIYSVEGKPRKVATLPGFATLTDLSGNTAVGVGALDPASGRFQGLVVDLASGEVKVYKPENASATYMVIHPEGWIVAGVEGPSGAWLERIDPNTMESRRLELPHGDLEEFGPMSFNYIGFLPDGALVVVGRKNGRSRIFLDGKQVDAPIGIHGGVYKWRGRLVTTYTSLKTPSSIVGLDGSRVLAGEVPDYVEEAISTVGFELVESYDGSKVPTFIVESSRAGKPGPTITLVHGGPFAETADVWDVFAASLALAGFNVVMPNYRGSTGYGEEWRLRIIGDPCGGELEDIVAASRWALESGLASNLYIMGYSYGGYMTMCALTRKPGIYKAGVAGASVVDWREMYELSDAAFKSFIAMLFAGKMDLLGERSPISYVDNLRDPLMIVHPQNDSRTPLKPVLKFMEKALEKGKSFEAYIAPDMGHAVNKVEDVYKILYPALAFLLRNREPLRDPQPH